MRQGTRLYRGLLLGLALCAFTVMGACGGRDTAQEEEYRLQGIALLEAGQDEAALEMFNAALAESVGVIGELEEDINMYKGMTLYRLERYEEAIACFDAVLEFDNKNSDAYYYRGTMLLEQGDEPAAVTDYNEAVKLENTYEMYISIAKNLQEQGYNNVATGYLRTALLIQPVSIEDKRSQAYIYYLNDDIETARPIFEELAAEGDEQSLVYLAQFAFEDGDYATCIAYADQGLAINGSRYGEFLFQKGVCLEYQEDYTGAAAVFKQYLQLYPEDEAAKKEATFLSTRE